MKWKNVAFNRSKEYWGKSLPIIKIYWLLISVTIAVVVAGVCVLLWASDTKASTIGSVAGACGGILAVVWFLAALNSQSKQLESQKEQFLAEFQTLREGARREALMFARDILKEAERKALKQNPKLNTTNEILANYLDSSSLASLKVILESCDPHEIVEQFKVWMNVEGPAIIMMRGIKSASEMYFRAAGVEGIDYSKEPEDFVFIYSPLFEKLPYFDTYAGPNNLLSEFLLTYQPGRKAAILAFQIALAKTSMKGLMKDEKLREELEARKASGLCIPKIAEDF